MRADAQLRRDVESELNLDSSIDASQIAITVNNGIVAFTGYVSHYYEKLEAERAVKRVSGVRGIADDIEVKLRGASALSDSEIAEAVATALEWDATVPDQEITPIVRNGYVTLEGTLEWEHQKSAAARAIRHLKGIKGINNYITVDPHHLNYDVTPQDIRKAIEAAFQRSAQLDARRLDVKIENHEVTLRGDVHCWAEYEEAERAAWAVPGVSVLHNHLTVTE